MSRVARAPLLVVVLVLVGGACGSCATASSRGSHVQSLDRSPHLEDAFDGDPALLIVVRPTKIMRDPLYGPLIRRASELASTRVAVGEAVGRTALAALERTDEVVLGAYDRDARDAVIGLRGVPADVEASKVLDTNGKPLWAHVRDLPGGVEELAPSDPSASGALFVLPRRAWVIAVGGAVERARAAFAEENRSGRASVGAIEDGPLVIGRLRGAALRRARPSLADGPLAPIARDLEVVSLSLEPGPEGPIGEVVGRFDYGEAVFAERAESCIGEVLAAFTRKIEASASWLRAVKVSRDGRSVILRGEIPRAWADGLIHVDLNALAR